MTPIRRATIFSSGCVERNSTLDADGSVWFPFFVVGGLAPHRQNKSTERHQVKDRTNTSDTPAAKLAFLARAAQRLAAEAEKVRDELLAQNPAAVEAGDDVPAATAANFFADELHGAADVLQSDAELDVEAHTPREAVRDLANSLWGEFAAVELGDYDGLTDDGLYQADTTLEVLYEGSDWAE